MSQRLAWFAVVLAGSLVTSTGALGADSGPGAGTDVAAFKVYAVTGEQSDQVVDIIAQRAGKPTLFCFVPKEKWSRPAARLLRQLDNSIGDVNDGSVVAVWVTEDAAQSREYLPKAQQSLQLSRTALTVYEEGPTGPPEWGINTAVDITIVAAKGGKVVKTFALISPNETDADEVLAALK